jgi:putative transposase
MLLVYRYRIKSLIGLLDRQARACNVVWNFCNETQQHALKWNKRWPTGFDRMIVISTLLAISSSVRTSNAC